MLYIGNFKMNIPTDDYIDSLIKLDKKGNEVGIALPFPYIYQYAYALNNADIVVGAQNVTEAVIKESTGEVSAEMLKGVGAEFVLVGHSERKKLRGETMSKIREKCEQALSKNLKVVLCVGESREDYENGNTSKVLEKQLREILNSLKNITYDNFIIAYEPIWAIGTGLIPTADDIEIVVRHIKSMTGKWAKCELRVLYGGSCKASNIKLIKCAEGIDGLMIGDACQDVKELQKIINA